MEKKVCTHHDCYVHDGEGRAEGRRDPKDCSFYPNPERDAALVLELDSSATSGPWYLDSEGWLGNEFAFVCGRPLDGSDGMSGDDRQLVMQYRTLAPRVARAYLEQRDTLLRLSGTFECGIADVERAVVSACEYIKELQQKVEELSSALGSAEQRAKQAEGALDRLQYGPGSQ